MARLYRNEEGILIKDGKPLTKDMCEDGDYWECEKTWCIIAPGGKRSHNIIKEYIHEHEDGTITYLNLAKEGDWVDHEYVADFVGYFIKGEWKDIHTYNGPMPHRVVGVHCKCLQPENEEGCNGH